MKALDDLDAKLEQERTRQARVLGQLATAITALSVEQAAEILPALAKPIDDLDQAARRAKLPRQ